MKFAFVVGFLGAAGGLNRSTQVLAKYLIAQGHEADILYWDCARRFDVRDVIAGRPCPVNIFGLSRHSLISNIVRKLMKILSGRCRHVLAFYYAYLASPILQRFLLRHAYDRIFIQDQHYIPVHRLKLPHTVVIHSNWQHAYLRHRLNILNTIKKKIYSRLLANKNIYTVSQGVRDNLIRCFAVPADNVVCTYNPIDFDHLLSMADREPATALPPTYWLAAGRLNELKRFDRLIKAYAMAQVPDDLVIMGTGRLQAQLQTIARQCGVQQRVHFIGFQSNPMPYYRRARALIVASDCEGFSLVVLESLACGTAVIATDCPSGPGEILRLVGLDAWLVFKPQDWDQPWPQEKEDKIVSSLAEKIRLFDRQPPSFEAAALRCFEPARVGSYYLQSDCSTAT